MGGYRKENDTLGEVKVPGNAYYGAFTQRAVTNFQISGMRLQGRLIRSIATIKKAAAITNVKLGRLDSKTGNAIMKACDEVLSGKFDDQFAVDVFQAGAGTSTNMNLNEVIANRAIEFLGGKKGNYKLVHPNDHVNMSQSTNDVFHTAIHISVYSAITEDLLPSLSSIEKTFSSKAVEFKDVFKVGRTHLQDAVPMTLGQEFSVYSDSVGRAIERISAANERLKELPIGGTALGSGINAPSGYKEEVVHEISRLTRYKFKSSKHLFYQLQDQGTEAWVSGTLKNFAVGLDKIANDLRLLSSGPKTGFEDISLPAVQPGSSIMPGKINPSIVEMVNMVCFEIIGNDATVQEAAQSGQLQLNVFMPIIAYNLLYSTEILSNAVKMLDKKCVRGIKANEKLLEERVEYDVSLATALSPYIGYKKAASIEKKALSENKTVADVAVELGFFTKEQIKKILNIRKLAGLKKSDRSK